MFNIMYFVSYPSGDFLNISCGTIALAVMITKETLRRYKMR